MNLIDLYMSSGLSIPLTHIGRVPDRMEAYQARVIAYRIRAEELFPESSWAYYVTKSAYYDYPSGQFYSFEQMAQLFAETQLLNEGRDQGRYAIVDSERIPRKEYLHLKSLFIKAIREKNEREARHS